MIAGVSMQFNIRVTKSDMVTDLGGRLSGPLIRGLGRDCSAVVESACAFPPSAFYRASAYIVWNRDIVLPVPSQGSFRGGTLFPLLKSCRNAWERCSHC